MDGDGDETGDAAGSRGSVVEPLRASFAETPARSVSEAEAELAKLVASGYRTVVAFDSRGEAERTRYGFERIDAKILDAGRAPCRSGVTPGRGEDRRRLHLAADRRSR